MQLAFVLSNAPRQVVVFNPDSVPRVESEYVHQFETAARSLKVAPITASVHGDDEIETAITSLRSEPGGGLIVAPGVYMNVHRATIISLAARYNLPAVYSSSDYARDGGLLSYGADLTDMFRRAASYVDRILRGATPADLPVQLPVKFMMTLNANTAKALSVKVPSTILVRADEVIE